MLGHNLKLRNTRNNQEGENYYPSLYTKDSPNITKEQPLTIDKIRLMERIFQATKFVLYLYNCMYMYIGRN